MFDRFTDRARKIMSFARQEAERFNHDYIGTEHILLGLVKEELDAPTPLSGIASQVLNSLHIDPKKIRMELEKIVRAAPDVVTMGQLPFTPRAKKVLEYAIDEARALDHNYVGSEHLLLGLFREEEGLAGEVLKRLAVGLTEVRERVMEITTPQPEKEVVEKPQPPETLETLSARIKKAHELGQDTSRFLHLLFDLLVKRVGAKMEDYGSTVFEEIPQTCAEKFALAFAIADDLPGARKAVENIKNPQQRVLTLINIGFICGETYDFLTALKTLDEGSDDEFDYRKVMFEMKILYGVARVLGKKKS